MRRLARADGGWSRPLSLMAFALVVGPRMGVAVDRGQCRHVHHSAQSATVALRSAQSSGPFPESLGTGASPAQAASWSAEPIDVGSPTARRCVWTRSRGWGIANESGSAGREKEPADEAIGVVDVALAVAFRLSHGLSACLRLRSREHANRLSVNRWHLERSGITSVRSRPTRARLPSHQAGSGDGRLHLWPRRT